MQCAPTYPEPPVTRTSMVDLLWTSTCWATQHCRRSCWWNVWVATSWKCRQQFNGIDVGYPPQIWAPAVIDKRGRHVGPYRPTDDHLVEPRLQGTEQTPSRGHPAGVHVRERRKYA